MKKTKTIQLEIHPDKVAEFYFYLLRYKISEQQSSDDLEQIVNAIVFDYGSLLSTFELSETQTQKIDDKLKLIHVYLFKSKKDSDDYLEVSKDNFEKFRASDFISELYNTFHIMEISKIWKGKEKTVEIKSLVATFSYCCLFIVRSIEQGLTGGLTNSIDVMDIKKNIEDRQLFISTFNSLDEIFSNFLKLPVNKRDETEERDRLIISIYRLLIKHYRSITFHSCYTITGYISSTLGLLDTETQHENSNRKQSYRKYLRDSINNIVHNHVNEEF